MEKRIGINMYVDSIINVKVIWISLKYFLFLLGDGCGNNINLGMCYEINIMYMYMYNFLVKLSVYKNLFMFQK